ncbi:hypothetical protein FRC11_004516 [Ceratobasidium sp. 423]|nr:hypothetical protein FRC11_004516 [Ceratobasidium sp. 423]
MPGIVQYKESIAMDKKHQEAAQHKKDLKVQGVGSTFPASRKVTASTKTAVDESSDEEFNIIQVEIQAEEACLWLMDEEELQKLWDAGETGKLNLKEKVKEKTKAKEKVPASNPSGSKVQAMGPAKKILAALSALSPVECASAKCKCPSPWTSKPQKSKVHRKSETLLLDKDSDLEGKDKVEDKDKDKEESKMEGEDEEDGDGKSTKKLSKGNAGHGKTKDFTSKVKKMVDFATIHLCTKLLTTGMFCLPDEYKVLVNKCWVQAADEYHVDYQSSKYKIWKAHRQMLHLGQAQISHCEDLPGEGQTPKEAEEHVVGLLPNVFHTKVSTKKGVRHFQHDYLQDTIFEAYYTGNNPIRLAYLKLFHLMPLKAIALSTASPMEDDSPTCGMCSSSISLDYEEETRSCEATPTPQMCTPTAISQCQLMAKPSDDKDDDNESEEEKEEVLSSDDDEETQPPPKKQKMKSSKSPAEKLVTSGKKSGKPSPATALKAGKFRITASAKTCKFKP